VREDIHLGFFRNGEKKEREREIQTDKGDSWVV